MDFFTRFTWEKTPQNNFCYVLNCGGLSWNVCWGSLAVFYCIEPWVMISWGYQHQYAPAQHPETTTIWFSKEVTDYPKKKAGLYLNLISWIRNRKNSCLSAKIVFLFSFEFPTLEVPHLKFKRQQGGNFKIFFLFHSLSYAYNRVSAYWGSPRLFSMIPLTISPWVEEDFRSGLF